MANSKSTTYKPKAVRRFVIDVLDYSDDYGEFGADEVHDLLFQVESFKAFEVREEKVK